MVDAPRRAFVAGIAAAVAGAVFVEVSAPDAAARADSIALTSDDLIADLVRDPTSLTKRSLAAAFGAEKTGVVYLSDYGGRADYSSAAGAVYTDNFPAWVAAKAACPSGGSIVITADASGSRYFSSQTWVIDKPLALVSAGVAGGADGAPPVSQLVFPVGVTGIHIRKNGFGERPSGWMLANLRLHGSADARNGDASGFGVHVTDGCGRIDNLVVEKFASHGYYLKAGATVGGGNVNNTVLDRVRAYSNYGDGIKLHGSDCQQILIVKPDVVANQGWGIHFDGASANEVIAPHFDQQYNGSPGIIRDIANSNVVNHIYAEQGSGNGTVVLLDREMVPSTRESTFFKCSFSQYAGQLSVIDRTVSRSSWIESRVDGKYREISITNEGNRQHKYRFDNSLYSGANLTLTYIGQNGSPLAGKPVFSYSRVLDQFRMFCPVVPNVDSATDLGSQANRWRNGHFSGYLRMGTFKTSTRPSAATAGRGAQIYDEVLSKPLFSDGTVWRDSQGRAA